MVNKVILLGHVGRDPEVRHMDNNLVTARFTLATSERWNKDGNRTEHTEWHNIVMWRGMAEVAEKYVRKGSLLYIEGRLRSRSYDDKDGVKRYVTEVIADTMNLVGPRPEGGQAAPARSTPQVAPIPPIETTGLDSVPPDDLPF
jgi:single-strand DNA-binding protein